MSDAHARRQWLFPAAGGVFDGIELALLEPEEEGDRYVLLLADHPELAAAIDRGDEEIVQHGVAMSPQLHLTMHDIVAKRILDDEPKEWWDTAQRLTSLGYERHEVLHMLSSVVSDEVYQGMRGDPREDDASTRALAALPGSWETMRPTPSVQPANRAERRALQRRQRDKRHR